MSCLTKETKNALMTMTKLNEVTLGLVMAEWDKDTNPNKDRLPTKDEVFNTLNSLKVKKNTVVKTESDLLRQYKNKIESRINTINNTLNKKNLSIKERTYLKERAKKLSTQSDQLTDDLNKALNDSRMFDIADEHLAFIERELSENRADPLSVREMNDIASYLDIYNSFASIYIPELKQKQLVENEAGEMVKVNTEVFDKALQIQSKAQALEIQFSRMSNVKTHELGQKHGQNIGEDAESLTAPVKDISWFDLQLRPLGVTGVKVLNIIKSYLDIANQKAEQLQNKYIEMVVPAFKALKESPLFKQYGYEIFYQRDEDGNRTGNTVTKYTYAFIKERKAMYDLLNKDTKTSTERVNNFKIWRSWHNANHTTYDVFDAYNLETGELINPDILNSIPQEYRQEAIDGIEKYIAEYQAHKNAYGEGSAQLQEWLIGNNPKMFNASAGASNIKNESYQYLVVKPNAKHLDTNYDLIMSDEATSKMYEVFQKITSDYIKSLPYSFVNSKGIQRNFIPFVRKGLFNTFKTEGWGIGIEQAKRKIADLARSSEQSDIVYNEVDANGDPMMSLPIHHMINATKIVDGVEVVDYSVKDLDMENILMSIIPTISQYQFKAATEDFIKHAYRTTEYMQEDKGIDKNGNPVASATGLSHIKEIAKFNMDVFYGKGNEKVGVSTVSIMTAQEKEELQKQKDLSDAKFKDFVAAINSDSSLSTEEKKTAILNEKNKNELMLKAKEKKFSGGQTVRSLLKYYTLKTLGFSPTAALNEIIQGSTSILIHSAGGEDFKFRDWMSSIKSRFTAKDKALRKLYGVINQAIDGDSTSGKLEKYANKLNEAADATSKGAVLIAKMKNTYIFNLDGGTTTLYDAYDENGNWNSSLFSDEINEQWSPKTELSAETNNFYQFQAQVKDLNVRLFGAYDINSPIYAKNSTLGKSIMMFKTWFGEAVAIRLEEKRYSGVQGREFKGRWRSLADVYSDNGLKKTLFALFTGRTDDLIFLDGDLDMANMKKDMVEMYLILGLAAATLLISAALKDDDDEDTVAYNAMFMTINTIGRLQQDLTYFMNPNEATKLQENLIPVLKLYKDFRDVGLAVGKTAFGDDEITQGVYRGWNRIFKEGAELVPISSIALKIYKYANSDLTE